MQGFNMGRYVPPDLEGTTTGNALHHKKPAGKRTRAADGSTVQTVRFEMPFAIWCSHCSSSSSTKKKSNNPTIIGQGVRFNAVKSRVGNYHSTPIWSFVMRHVVCGGEIEIRTDPQNTAYVVYRGGQRRDYGEEKVMLEEGVGEGGLRILTDKEREGMRRDAFRKLERTIEDREVMEMGRERLEEIEEAQRSGWEDPYERNARLRREFRVGRKEREREGRMGEDLKDRLGFGFDLVEESELDKRRAGLVDFGGVADGQDAELGSRALAKPLFANKSASATSSPGRGERSLPSLKPVTASSGKGKALKSEIVAAKRKEDLVSGIMSNTRLAKDPFLTTFSDSRPSTPRITGIKRKKAEAEEENSVDGLLASSAATVPTKSPKTEEGPDRGNKRAAVTATLVEYDSD